MNDPVAPTPPSSTSVMPWPAWVLHALGLAIMSYVGYRVSGPTPPTASSTAPAVSSAVPSTPPAPGPAPIVLLLPASSDPHAAAATLRSTAAEIRTGRTALAGGADAIAALDAAAAVLDRVPAK